jgi:hypothetical protein
MERPAKGALFADTVRPVPFRAVAGVDTGEPRVDAGAGFARRAGPSQQACWRATLPAGLLACCALNEVALAGFLPGPIELLVRRVPSRTETP